MKKSFLYVGMLSVALSMSMTSCHDSESASDIENPEVEETAAKYFISGKVTSTEGNALSGIKVLVDGNESAVTGTDGMFTVENLAAKKYALVFKADGYAQQSTSVVLASAKYGVVSATVNVQLVKPQAADVSTTEGATLESSVASSTVSVGLPAAAEASQVEVAMYIPAPAQIVSAPKAVSNEAVDAYPLAIDVVNYKFVAGSKATLSVATGTAAETDYLAMTCVNGNSTVIPTYTAGIYSANVDHFSAWLFKVKDMKRTISGKTNGTKISGSVSNATTSDKNMNITLNETTGYELTTDGLAPGVAKLVKAAINNIEGVAGTAVVKRSIPLAVSGMTKVDYEYANTYVTTTYTIYVHVAGAATATAKTVTVKRYTGLVNTSLKASIIGHSGGSGN